MFPPIFDSRMGAPPKNPFNIESSSMESSYRVIFHIINLIES